MHLDIRILQINTQHIVKVDKELAKDMAQMGSKAMADMYIKLK